MVLESLLDSVTATKKPSQMFWIGALYSTIALFLSYWVFKDYSSLILVFLTTAAAIPIMYNAIVKEEAKDLEDYSESRLLKEHGKALSFFMFLFVGVTVALAFWYVVLPGAQVNVLFDTQTATINAINGAATGHVFAEDIKLFGRIFTNNLKVLTFSLLFSFLYGTGAIFILTWNASVIATAIGDFVRKNLALIADAFSLTSAGAYVGIIGQGLFRYVIHGVPEILAYFTAGLAGGIISIAVIKKHLETKKFEHIVLDSADLIFVSLALLLLAAVLEVWVTPIFF